MRNPVLYFLQIVSPCLPIHDKGVEHNFPAYVQPWSEVVASVNWSNISRAAAAISAAGINEKLREKREDLNS